VVASLRFEIKKATLEHAKQLHGIVMAGMADKTNEVYRANVERFGIPEEYVRQAFSIEALTAAVKDKKQLFLVAVEGERLIGFAQTIRDDKGAAELDRIFLIPEHTGKGIGTRLLNKTMNVLRSEGISRLTVKAGKNETLARRFYEKNGFRLVQEVNVQAPWGRELNLALYELEIAS
jgi:ribosomal protein S18 acetylase RimI-like enzyme